MTLSHLLFAAATTAYILLAIQFESGTWFVSTAAVHGVPAARVDAPAAAASVRVAADPGGSAGGRRRWLAAGGAGQGVLGRLRSMNGYLAR